jgi:Cupin-like domain
MLKCFSEPFEYDAIDRYPFEFRHQLLGHPALGLENLARMLPALPSDQVFYSKGLSDLGINFDRAHVDHPNGMSIEQTIESIRTSNSYIAVSKPEMDPSFKELFRDITEDVSAIVRRRGTGTQALEPTLWLFIASPGAITPFHCDRYSNFLMQFRGSKEVAIFKPWNDEVISPEDCEAWVARTNRPPTWRPEADRFAHKYHFKPGEAAHIPFVAGHYVKNGSEDVSITLSYFFHTEDTLRMSRALTVNHRLRSRLQRLGMQPTPIGRSRGRDRFKADVVHPLMEKVAVLLKRRSDEDAPGSAGP